jgi:tetratricopeptide (TPR) repeat protein
MKPTAYPAPLGDLLTLGETKAEPDYDKLAERLKDYVPDLIRMVLDEDLNKRKEDDPAVWAPYHALHVLGALHAEEAAEPLLACLEWDDDWILDVLPEVYAGIGPSAIPILQAYLADPAHSHQARNEATGVLAAIGKADRTAREGVTKYLTAFLDRPGADDSAAEEALTTAAIVALLYLQARSAYPAIQRAFSENRVNLAVVAMEDVEQELRVRPTRPFSKRPARGKEAGIKVVLRCKVCGRERPHVFPKVYCDLGTVKDKKKLARYGPLVIPQRVVCPKCGATDQYELAGMAYLALMADVLARTDPKLAKRFKSNEGVEYIDFTTRWGPMHPQEAIERYRREIARHPNNASLRVGYGNVLDFLGRSDEAEVEYQEAVRLEPGNPEGWVNLAQLAERRKDAAAALEFWQRTLDVTPASRLPREARETILAAARNHLSALRAGKMPRDLIMEPRRYELAQQPAPTTREPQVDRNALCPCGSGRKYRYCHGRVRSRKG